MSKYLLSVTETYRVDTVEEVEQMHEDFVQAEHYDLMSFSYKTKQKKSKGEIVEEYQVVSAKKIFNDEKDIAGDYEVNYQRVF